MRALRACVCLAGVVVIVALVPVVHRSPLGTYGGADVRALVLEASAALALALVAATGRPTAAALVIAATGMLWLVPELAGAAAVPMGVRTLAAASAPVVTVLLLVGVELRDEHEARRRTPAPLLALVGATVAALATVLLVDPFDDPSCWRTCAHNRLALGLPAGEAAQLVGFFVLAAGATWAAAPRLGTARAPRPRIGADTAAWVAVVGLALGNLVGLPDGPPGSGSLLGPGLFVVVNGAVLAWPVWLGWEEWRRWRLEIRLTQVVDLLRTSSSPGALAASLRQAVPDPGLRIAFWAPARHTYVDDEGHLLPQPGPRGAHERATTIARHGQTIALVVHSAKVDGRRLERALTPALRLVLENAQLRAGSLAELAELMDSRTRVVERAEVERRRLERNLHDGAQQRAVSLALLVRMAAGSPHVDPESSARAGVLARTLVEELRRVARGIYPAVLADAGLSGAVADLAERSTDLPVVVGDLPRTRFQGAVETTAFLVVSSAIADARSRGATSLTVEGRRCDGTLQLTVRDEGTPEPASVAPHLVDQVGALGGIVAMRKDPDRLEVVLPCTS